jgi:hypothetical protein
VSEFGVNTNRGHQQRKNKTAQHNHLLSDCKGGGGGSSWRNPDSDSVHSRSGAIPLVESGSFPIVHCTGDTTGFTDSVPSCNEKFQGGGGWHTTADKTYINQAHGTDDERTGQGRLLALHQTLTLPQHCGRAPSNPC